MKITTFYHGEIEVNVTSDDIKVMLMVGKDPAQSAAMMINDVCVALKGVPDDLIPKFTESQRKLIREFLELQANRYEEPAPRVKAYCTIVGDSHS